MGGERLSTKQYFRRVSDACGVPMPAARMGRALSLIFDGGRAARELGLSYRPIRESPAEAISEMRGG